MSGVHNNNPTTGVDLLSQSTMMGHKDPSRNLQTLQDYLKQAKNSIGALDDQGNHSFQEVADQIFKQIGGLKENVENINKQYAANPLSVSFSVTPEKLKKDQKEFSDIQTVYQQFKEIMKEQINYLNDQKNLLHFQKSLTHNTLHGWQATTYWQKAAHGLNSNHYQSFGPDYRVGELNTAFKNLEASIPTTSHKELSNKHTIDQSSPLALELTKFYKDLTVLKDRLLAVSNSFEELSNVDAKSDIPQRVYTSQFAADIQKINDDLQELKNKKNKEVVRLDGEIKKAADLKTKLGDITKAQNTQIKTNLEKIWENISGQYGRYEENIYLINELKNKYNIKDEEDEVNDIVDKNESDIVPPKESSIQIEEIKNEVEEAKLESEESIIENEDSKIETKEVDSEIEEFKNEIEEFKLENEKLKNDEVKVEQIFNNLKIPLDMNRKISEQRGEIFLLEVGGRWNALNVAAKMDTITTRVTGLAEENKNINDKHQLYQKCWNQEYKILKNKPVNTNTNTNTNTNNNNNNNYNIVDRTNNLLIRVNEKEYEIDKQLLKTLNQLNITTKIEKYANYINTFNEQVKDMKESFDNLEGKLKIREDWALNSPAKK